jgi:hypothetical protein
VSADKLHPLWQILQKSNKTAAEQVICTSVCILSTQHPFRNLTPEQVYDELAKRWEDLMKQVHEHDERR